MISRSVLLSVAAIVLAGCGGGSSSAPPTSGGTGTPAPSPSPSPSPSPTSSPVSFDTLAFEDQFAAGTLDRSVWNVEGPAFWVNNEAQAYIDSSDTIFFDTATGADDGKVLVLKPVWRPGFATPTGRIADFVSGRIDTANKFDVTYAKVSARIRMPDAKGAWPAFWLLGYGAWPDAGETDIMEYVGEKDWTSSALHGPGYSGNTPITARQTFPAGQDVTGWHVYSVERRDQDIRFFVDDREFYRVTKADVERYGPWRFDRRQYIILNFALGGTYPQAINGVASPYAGLPTATVDQIKAGALRVEVDWVRVWR